MEGIVSFFGVGESPPPTKKTRGIHTDDDTDARKAVISAHRRVSSQLDRARSRACHLKTILEQLNDAFADADQLRTLPCDLYDEMDRMLRQAGCVRKVCRYDVNVSVNLKIFNVARIAELSRSPHEGAV